MRTFEDEIQECDAFQMRLNASAVYRQPWDWSRLPGVQAAGYDMTAYYEYGGRYSIARWWIIRTPDGGRICTTIDGR